MPTVSLSDLPVEYDPEDPSGWRAGRAPLRTSMGARETGATLYELPPGQALCNYHFEYGEEEWALVLDGAPTLRTPDGERVLAPHDLAFFPTGPEGAHQLHNAHGETTARVLLWSAVRFPSVTEYPDSGKVGVWTQDGSLDLVARRSDEVGYYVDEPPRGGG